MWKFVFGFILGVVVVVMLCVSFMSNSIYNEDQNVKIRLDNLEKRCIIIVGYSPECIHLREMYYRGGPHHEKDWAVLTLPSEEEYLEVRKQMMLVANNGH